MLDRTIAPPIKDAVEFNLQLKKAEQFTLDNGIPVYSINAPSFLTGIDFSDHLSYWNEGFVGMMVTDTAFFRNEAYHTEDDTPDRLDYARMAKVVEAVVQVVVVEAVGY